MSGLEVWVSHQVSFVARILCLVISVRLITLIYLVSNTCFIISIDRCLLHQIWLANADRNVFSSQFYWGMPGRLGTTSLLGCQEG
jgi:hypothetical protein